MDVDVVKFTYFIDKQLQPTKMCLMFTPMPTEWVDGFSPLTRIAARLTKFGNVVADESRNNVLLIEFCRLDDARVSNVIYAFKDAVRGMFNSRIEFFFTKDCRHYNYPCDCHHQAP